MPWYLVWIDRRHRSPRRTGIPDQMDQNWLGMHALVDSSLDWAHSTSDGHISRFPGRVVWEFHSTSFEFLSSLAFFWPVSEAGGFTWLPAHLLLTAPLLLDIEVLRRLIYCHHPEALSSESFPWWFHLSAIVPYPVFRKCLWKVYSVVSTTPSIGKARIKISVIWEVDIALRRQANNLKYWTYPSPAVEKRTEKAVR